MFAIDVIVSERRSFEVQLTERTGVKFSSDVFRSNVIESAILINKVFPADPAQHPSGL